MMPINEKGIKTASFLYANNFGADVVNVRHEGSNPSQIYATKKRLPTKVCNRFFLAEKDQPYQKASFISQYL